MPPAFQPRAWKNSIILSKSGTVGLYYYTKTLAVKQLFSVFYQGELKCFPLLRIKGIQFQRNAQDHACV